VKRSSYRAQWSPPRSAFAEFRFPAEVIVVAVRWYLWLRYQERRWIWPLDPYWHPDRVEVCESVPSRIRAAIGC
jgi:hypothetical protein